MRAALYARVSSVKQRDARTIESQLPALHEFARARNWIVAGIYTDDGHTAKSGHLEARTDWQRLCRDMAAGLVDVVVVVEQKRVTRAEDLTERGAILGTLQRHRVKLAIADTGTVLDLNTTEGDLLVSMGGWLSAEDNRQRRANVMRGKARAITEGRKPAGPTPYGYRYDRATGAWSIDEAEALVILEIYRRVAAGESTQAIADDLTARGVPRHQVVGRAPQWERARVYAIARSTTYRGEWLANKARRLTIAVRPIVTDELWHAAQASFLERNVNRLRGLSRVRHIYLLQGLAVCELCGGAIHVAGAQKASWTARNTKRPPSPARYVCVNHRRAPAGGERCALPYLKVADVDARLWARLVAELRPDQVARASSSVAEAVVDAGTWQQDLVTAESQLARLQRTETALLDRFRRELISEAAMDAQLGTIKRERALLSNQVAAAGRARQRAGAAQTRARSVRDLAAELGRRIAGADLAAQRELVELLLEPGSIVLGPTRISARGLISLGAPSSTICDHGTKLRFRIVG